MVVVLKADAPAADGLKKAARKVVAPMAVVHKEADARKGTATEIVMVVAPIPIAKEANGPLVATKHGAMKHVRRTARRVIVKSIRAISTRGTLTRAISIPARRLPVRSKPAKSTLAIWTRETSTRAT